jgi:hypothetical protein
VRIAPLEIARGVVGGVRGLGRPDAGSRSGRSYAVTLMTPVRRGEEQALAAHLDGLGGPEQSPLAKLPHVHFGRWVLIDQLKLEWPGVPAPPPRLESQYLYFSASVTAPDGGYAADLPESFFRDLAARIPKDADAIWRHCVAYPGISDVDAFVRYLAAGQIHTSLFYVGYADVTVDEVRRALAARKNLVTFVLDHQDEENPAALQRAYLEASRKWFRST